jgi:DNA-binding NarL/FixJ family response regulator
MRIFVIDDHPLMREAIGGLIRRLRPSAKVVEIERMSNMGKMVAEHGEAELVCLDLKMPDTNGVSAVREIRQLMPDTVIVVVSASSASDYAELTREVGADAYVEKSAGAQESGRVLREYLTDEVDDGSAPIVPTKLSKRQKQLLLLLDRGLSNRDIATELEISEHTVKAHLWRLFRRLNVKSRSQASHLARTARLIEL